MTTKHKKPVLIDELREELAALEHEQWAHWTDYFLFRLSILTEPAWKGEVERWQRQMQTPYAKLTDGEKRSDREWADKVLGILNIPPRTGA